MNSLDQPHHDGSALYVSNMTPILGDVVALRLRVPSGFPTRSVHVRYLCDGEPQFRTAAMGQSSSLETWWMVRDVPVHNPTLQYRWLIEGGPSGYTWVNGSGVHDRDVPDADDFRILAYPSPPAWSADAIIYQVFLDRFARSVEADARHLPDWANPVAWDDPVSIAPGAAAHQLYGGDLPGVRSKLDYISALGANTIYLTPFFPATSSHRYDASTFEHVDPILGGDQALIDLVEACHARGLRVLGDITTNHTGVTHEWFQTALADPSSPEHDFYLWRADGGYEGWLDVPSLPKLNYRSAELRRRMFGEDGIIRKWLSAPYNLDGWRVDVANMTGRYRDHDDYAEVARQMRAAMDAIGDKLLVAEHGHDLHCDVPGDGWHGAMNYSGFTRPLWTWLRQPGEAPQFLGSPLMVPRLSATQAAETMQAFAAQLPWSVSTHSFNLAGSHDTTRIATLVNDPDVQVAAAVLVYTMPGIPMVTYGDEIGMPGAFGEDGRRPFPWNDNLDANPLLGVYRQLSEVRHRLASLRHGGLRWVTTTDDCLVYLRETFDEATLVAVHRRAHDPVSVRLAILPGLASAHTLFGATPTVLADRVELGADRPGATICTWRTGRSRPWPSG